MPKKLHKISAQLPSPVKARIISSKKGSVEIRYSMSGAQLGTNSAGRLCKYNCLDDRSIPTIMLREIIEIKIL